MTRLREALFALEAAMPPRGRHPDDPVGLLHRYRDPRDLEVAGLLAASLAYGRVSLFRPRVEALLLAMGVSPAAFVAELRPSGAARLLSGFVYRFNVGADVAVLLLGMGRALREQGSLEAAAVGEGSGQGVRAALHRLTSSLRESEPEARGALGPTRGLSHLLPSPMGPGASKRLNLYLRWMVRGPDEVDFGIWRRLSPSELVLPLDTHVHRLALHLGLTSRRDASWRTAEEITARLRQVAPDDPVRFDFVLCHHGMSGGCPVRPAASACASCVLLPSCRTGPRRVGARQPGLAPGRAARGAS